MLNIEEFADRNELFDGHYALIRPLSVDGATADVWLALDANTLAENANIEEIIRMDEEDIGKLGLLVAIKVYRPQNALDIEGEQRFRDEYMIVFNCHHTNLIHPTHFSIFMETPYLVLPYCKLGSSEALIGTEFSTDDIWKYILDVSSGLAYLHALEPPIIHQDIKPANILLDDTHHYAITDFGISAQRGGTHVGYYDEENSGTLAYMAPERFLEGAEPMSQSDIWAFGATLYEILTGNVPFGEEGGKNQLESDTPLSPVTNVPAAIQRLISACLAKKPEDRPSAEQLIEAAKAKQFPLRSKRFLYIGLSALGVFLVLGLVLFLNRTESSEPIEVYQPTIEELYEKALRNLDSNNVDSVNAGFKLMDSLSNYYVPAIYECAYTYGWYNESKSKQRKRLLKINMDKEGCPISGEDIAKAINYSRDFLNKADTTWSEKKGESAHNLASYYSTEAQNTNDSAKRKEYYTHSKKCLQDALTWAEAANDTNLSKQINDELENFKTIN